MTLSRTATVLSLIGAAFILYIGISYLFAPDTIAPGFGLPAWPDGDAAAFMNLKGVRDTVFGVLILVLLGLRQRYALGIVTSVVALVPIGDMLTVLSWHGSAAAAFGIHGLTAALVALTGALLIREHSLGKDHTTASVAVTA
ncbi:DUF4267 domain-containing protein [Nocardia gipuzkoensis]|jgi:hypothetical protein|uniref:DUF4267 domain-containing protein n=1 Tax=Nocardia TaxID=1817 RepID=UPI001895CFA4|nr:MULTISPECIES: DUF4267 domain-containing protein [Nocardia]MBF6471405.1 DUF4267 domain-containing protein [Nocardia abscessus]UGT65574.1 DUF4267 domain-containing protein [Nocardia gipuzkoensis]